MFSSPIFSISICHAMSIGIMVLLLVKASMAIFDIKPVRKDPTSNLTNTSESQEVGVNCHLHPKQHEIGRGILDQPFTISHGVCESSIHGGVCYAKRVRAFQFPVQNGVAKLEDHGKCRFVNDSRRCRRYSKVEIIFPGTANEKLINSGYCIGGCDVTGLSCQPVLSEQVAISLNSTNNLRRTELVSVVRQCDCVGACYRISNKVTYSVINTRNGKRVVEDLEIDFGKCVSPHGCPIKHLCNNVDPHDPLPDLIGTSTCLSDCDQPQVCQPIATSRKKITLVSMIGHEISVTVTDRCGCVLANQC